MNKNIFVLLCLVGSASVFAQADRYEWPRQPRQEDQGEQQSGSSREVSKPAPYLPKVIQTITSSDNSFNAERADQNPLDAQDEFKIGLQVSEISKAKGALLQDLIAGKFSINVVLHPNDATKDSYVKVSGNNLTIHVYNTFYEYNHEQVMSYQIVSTADIAAKLDYKGELDAGCTGTLDEKIKCLLIVE